MGPLLSCVFISAVALVRYSFAVDMNDFFPNINNNYTKVTWAHAVNNQALLNDTLRGYSGIVGNTRADQLAKQALSKVDKSEEYPLTKEDCMSYYNARRSWRDNYECISENGKFYKALFGKPTKVWFKAEICLRNMGDLMMIEADIVLGILTNQEYIEKIPVMGHPPATTSDLSLAMFLQWIMDYNEAAMKNGKKDTGKGIKLDFKTIEVFEASIPILLEVYEKMNFPVWINADILRGPLNFATPVDPERFFNGSKSLSSSILSVGWTTTYGGIIKNLSYTTNNMVEMLEVLGKYNDVGTPITFPVRAGMIARSKTELEYLMSNMPKNTTITIWSGADDVVDVSLLRMVIFGTGLDRVFIDVPTALLSQLDLGNPDNHLHKYSPFVRGDAAQLFTATISILACFIVCIINSFKRY